MKLLMLADIHFGVRSDSPFFRKKHEEFFSGVIEYLENNDIDKVFILGDVMDKRKSCDYSTIKYAISQLDEIAYLGFEINILVGNHDSYFKNTLEINSPKMLFRPDLNPMYKVYDKPVDVDGICIIPWICDDNYDDCMNIIKNSKSEVCFGHFELNGFQYNKSTISSGGMDAEFLSKFKTVITGHYHLKSNNKNVFYLGSPIQMNWDDYMTPKGFHVFDTETNVLKFFENKESIFKILHNMEDFGECTDKIVRVVVDSDVDKKKLDSYLRKLQETNPHDVKVIYNQKEKVVEESVKIDCVNTKQSIVNFSPMYIEEDMSEEKMNNIINEVYIEALNLE